MVILSGKRTAVSLDTRRSGKGERKEPSSSFLPLHCGDEEVWASPERGRPVLSTEKAPAPGQNLELTEPPPAPIHNLLPTEVTHRLRAVRWRQHEAQ